ncbi:MAG: type IV pilus secretin PilQ [Desulfohalobiaceae bacterium]
MNNLARKTGTINLLHMVSSSGIYILLFLFLWGCSTTPGPETQASPKRIQSTDTQINQPFTQLPEDVSDKNRPSPEKDNQSRSLKFQEQEQGSCLLLIPAPGDVQVQAEYEHPELTLNFSPGIPRPDLAQIPEACPAQEIEFLPADSQEIQGLQLKLKERIQFLVSRSEPGQVRLSLVSRSQQQREQKTSAAQNEESEDPEASPRLKDLDFSLDQDQQLRITLQASGPIQYQPLPQKDDEIRILLPQIKIPQALDKFYNLDKFQAAAKSLWLEETDSGSELRISLKQRVPFNVERQDDQLLISFQDFISPKEEDDPEQSSVQELEKAQAPSQSAKLGPEQIPSPEEAMELQEASLASPRISPGLQGEYQGKRISIDLQDAEVEHVLRLIAEVGDFNLILDEEVQGKISLKLTKVPWDQALDLVLMQKDLGKVHKGNIMRIATAEKLEKEQQRIIQARKSALEAQQSQQEIAPLQTEYIQINYAKATQIEPQIENFLSDRGQVSVDSRTNQLIVSDTAKKLEQIQGVIQKLDRPERQVLIEARLVYATDSFQRSMGIRWSGNYRHDGDKTSAGSQSLLQPADDDDTANSDSYVVNLPAQDPTTLGLGAFVEKLSGHDQYRLDAELTLGEDKDQVQIISSPRVVTLTNQRAQIEQGTRVRVNRQDEAGNTITEYVDALLKLSVTPQITPDNKIILDLDISDDTAGTGDDIDTKRTQTKLMVDNRQTIVLGGVQQVTEENAKGRVPGLANLPLLGHLFQNRYNSKDKRELLIFIQPRIVETR